jgi:uncharacterized phage infection (PIP) family protein YhgE
VTDSQAEEAQAPLTERMTRVVNRARDQDQLADAPEVYVDDLVHDLSDVRGEVAEMRGELASVHSAVTQVQGDLEAIASGVEVLITTSEEPSPPPPFGAEIEARLANVEDTLDRVAERLEAANRGSLASGVERLDQIDARIGLLIEKDAPERTRSTQLAAFGEAVTEALDEVSTGVQDGLTQLSEILRTSLEAQRSALELQTGQLEPAVSGAISRDLAPVVERAVEQVLSARLSAALVEAVEAVAPGVMIAATGPALVALQEEARENEHRVVDGVEMVRTLVEQIQRDALTVVEDIRTALAADREGARVDAVEVRVEAAAADQLARDEMLDAVAEAVAEIRAAAAEELHAGSALTRRLVEDVTEAAARATEELSVAAREQLAAVAVALESSTAAFDGACSSLERIEARFGSAGMALVSYLAERDADLEEIRDRTLRDVLEEFGAGLKNDERRKLSAQVAAAVDRRRDTRDAERWRTTGSGGTVPAAPAFDPAAAAEIEAIVTVTKAPVKKAPVKKTGAKAVATKTTTKRIPPADTPR